MGHLLTILSSARVTPLLVRVQRNFFSSETEPQDKTTQRVSNYCDFFVTFLLMSLLPEGKRSAFSTSTKVTKKNRALTFVTLR